VDGPLPFLKQKRDTHVGFMDRATLLNLFAMRVPRAKAFAAVERQLGQKRRRRKRGRNAASP